MEAFGEELVNGFWFDGYRNHALTDLSLTPGNALTEEDAVKWSEGNPEEQEAVVEHDGGSEGFQVRPETTTPISLEDDGGESLLNRSSCRYVREDSVEGGGYMEFNRVVSDLET